MQIRRPLYGSMISVAIVTFSFVTLGATLSMADSQGPVDGDATITSPAYQATVERMLAADQAQEQSLSTPSSEQEREESKTEFADAGPGHAAHLADEQFGDALNEASSDPAQDIDSGEITHFIDDHTLVANRAGQGRELVSSLLPLRTDDTSDGSGLVDLSLEPDGQNYTPGNPLVPVEIPARADTPLRVGGGTDGFSVSLQDADASEGASNQFDDRAVFYGEALRDTDLIYTPSQVGAEVFAQLRSPLAPSSIKLDIGAAGGTSIGMNPDGSATVSRSDGAALSVSAPLAEDAQGTEVPTRMVEADDQTLKIEVDHRDGDFAYPVMLDPVLSEISRTESLSNSGVRAMFVKSGGPDIAASSATDGLQLFAAKGPYQASDYAAWNLKARPLTTSSAYYNQVNFGPFNFALNGNFDAHPHGYFGIWNSATADWTMLSVWGGGSGAASGATVTSTPTGSSSYAPVAGGKTAIFGLGGGSNPNLLQTRTLKMYGLTVHMKDAESPVMNSLGLSGAGAAWTKGGSVALTPASQDDGLGVSSVRLDYQATSGAASSTATHGCTGAPESACPQQWAPTGTAMGISVDPPSATNIKPLAEGIQTITATASDPLGKESATTASTTKTVRVDRAGPVLTLSGGLNDPAAAGNQLHAVAADGNAGSKTPADRATARSGVKSIALFLDGSSTAVVTTGNQTCADPDWGSCGGTLDFASTAANLPEGDHHFELVAIDQAGNETHQSWDKTIERDPPTISLESSPGLETGWFSTDHNMTINIKAEDAGAGVRRIEMSQTNLDGDPVVTAPFDRTCGPGLSTACGHAETKGIQLNTADLPPASSTVAITAIDGAGKRSNTLQIPVKRDVQSPSLDVNGTPLETGGAGDDEYQLSISAEDGSPELSESGIAELDASVDGISIDSTEQPCATGNCSANMSTTLDTSGLSAGSHLLRVTATDHAGNTSTHEQHFDAGPDQTPPVVVASGSVWDDNDVLGPNPRLLTIDARDLGSGVKKATLSIDGTAVDHREQDCADGACPLSSWFLPDFAELSAGQHQLSIRVEDIDGTVTTIQRSIQTDPLQATFHVAGDLRQSDATWFGPSEQSLTVSGESPSVGPVDAKLLIDGVQTDFASTSCAVAPCQVSLGLEVDLGDVPPGSHDAQVVVSSNAHDARERWTFRRSDTGQISLPAAADTLDAAAPSPIAPSSAGTVDGQPVDPTLTPSNGNLDFADTTVPGSISTDPAEGFTLGAGADAVHLSPNALASATTTEQVQNDSAVSANVRGNVDLSIRPQPFGASVSEQIRDPQAAPLSWEVDVPSGQSLEMSEDGGAQIVDDSTGSVAAVISAPMSTDGAGQTSSGSFVIASNGRMSASVPASTSGPAVIDWAIKPVATPVATDFSSAADDGRSNPGGYPPPYDGVHQCFIKKVPKPGHPGHYKITGESTNYCYDAPGIYKLLYNGLQTCLFVKKSGTDNVKNPACSFRYRRTLGFLYGEVKWTTCDDFYKAGTYMDTRTKATGITKRPVGLSSETKKGSAKLWVCGY